MDPREEIDRNPWVLTLLYLPTTLCNFQHMQKLGPKLNPAQSLYSQNSTGLGETMDIQCGGSKQRRALEVGPYYVDYVYCASEDACI